jgi:hypothetical protein
MRKTCFISTAIFFIVVACAQAQEDFPRLEFGTHFTILDMPAVHEMPGGFGGRIGYNFLPWMGMDGEFNYFPVRDTTQCVQLSGGSMTGGPCASDDFGHFGEMQMFAGIKSGIRSDRFGIFGKIRPGFIHFSDRQHMEYYNNSSLWRFALDVGGVMEIYLNRFTAIRIDLGVTLVDFGGWKSIEGYPSQETINHGFQGGAGIMFQF